ncbi:MAG TPA: DUF411 domain-containing protein [Vicinamibacterales bacterium]|nr:DUF411 domain-containing protein [Vicinamibacterales bacterium]
MLTTLMSLLLALALSGAEPPPQAAREKRAGAAVTVYRSKTCGCCGKWVDHLKAAGFNVTVHIVESLDKAPGRDRVPADLRSCHIATAGRYVVEGHVPADVIKDLLRRNPAVEGIAVPGMPAGSPGMESATPQPYDVVAFDKAGRRTTFARR